MNDRKRIIIQTGADPDESLPTPHFDSEATLTARPVVPLSEQDAFQKQYGGYAGGAQKPFWKRPALLALIVLVATGVGVAAGLAIGIYRNRQAAPTPIVSAPSQPEEKADASQPIEQPAPTPTRQARATIQENPVETPVEPKAEERERTNERSVRNERKSDDEEAAPPVVVRDKKRDKRNDDDESVVLDEKQAERERKRDERRERRRRQRDEEQAVDVPRQVERVERGVNRIREIFEGRQP
jgi:type IV secretory pathway VirB10-like protein